MEKIVAKQLTFVLATQPVYKKIVYYKTYKIRISYYALRRQYYPPAQ